MRKLLQHKGVKIESMKLRKNNSQNKRMNENLKMKRMKQKKKKRRKRKKMKKTCSNIGSKKQPKRPHCLYYC